MSIIFKGDIISNFGRYLPAPYIRKLDVTDESIDVTMSVFLNVDEEEDVTALVETLAAKVNFVIYFTLDGKHFDSIIDGTANIFDYYVEQYTLSGTWSTPYTDKDLFIPLDNVFESDGEEGYTYLVDDSIFDDEGNRIWEFRYTYSILYDDPINHAWWAYWYILAERWALSGLENVTAVHDAWYQENSPW